MVDRLSHDPSMSGALNESIECRIKLVHEARELFGVQAARRLWFGLGLPYPDGRRPAAHSASEIEEFVSTVLVRDQSAEIPAKAAYEAFSSWARANGRPVRTLTAFGLVMQSAGVARRHSGGTRYVGYRLPDPPTPSSRVSSDQFLTS